MRKFVIMLISLAVVSLLISSATAVPQVQNESNLKRLKKSEEFQKIIENRVKRIEELKNDNQILKNDYKEILVAYQQSTRGWIVSLRFGKF